MVTARARGAELVSVRAAAHVTPHKHCGVAALDGEADGEDAVTLPSRTAPRRIPIGIASNQLTVVDLGDEVPRLLAEGAEGFADEPSVGDIKVGLLDAVEVATLREERPTFPHELLPPRRASHTSVRVRLLTLTVERLQKALLLLLAEDAGRRISSEVTRLGSPVLVGRNTFMPPLFSVTIGTDEWINYPDVGSGFAASCNLGITIMS